MSLLIKALKRAEQKHDEAKLASQNEAAAEAVEQAASSTDQSAEQNSIQIELDAVDTEDAELAIELAQMQQSQADSADAQVNDDIRPIPLPELEIGVESANTASTEVQSTTDTAGTRLSFESTGASLSTLPESRSETARPPLELEGVSSTSAASTANAAGAVTASAFAAQAAAPDVSHSPQSSNRSSAGATATQARSRINYPSGAPLSRVIVYSLLGISVAACIGWFALNMMGFSFNTSKPVASPAPSVATAPTSGLDGSINEEQAQAAAKSAEPDARSASATAASGEKQQKATNPPVLAASSNTRSTEAVKPAVLQPKPGPTVAAPAQRQSGSAALPGNPTTGKTPANQVVSSPASNSTGTNSTAANSTAASNAESRIPEGTPSGIRLSRSETFAEQTLKMNERAWQLLSRNEKTAARNLYEEVLRLDRNNGDAWLGLATIAVKLGDPASAELHYRKALDIDPNDVAAKAGLLSLRSNHEPNVQESRLRHLLEQGGGQPALLFALGNSLASQARWADAQQAYFAAYTADQGNADYAFNLAVSLERLRQPQAAANLYRKALELADRRPAQFDRNVAERRLSVLQPSSQAATPAASTAPAATVE